MECMDRLGELIKEARERRGYQSQSALARAIDRDQSFVSRIERGAMKELPTPENLRLIGDALGLTMEQMLEAAGYIEPHAPREEITVPTTDPRAKLLELIAHEDDAGVEWITGILTSVLDVERMARPR